MKKIIIIDRDSGFINTLKDHLAYLGYEVCGSAPDYSHAADLVDEITPDLALVEVHLEKNSDGIETGLRLKNNFNLPVIFLCTDRSANIVRKAKTADPYGFIYKPVDIENLQAVLEIAFNRMEIYKNLYLSEKKYRVLFEQSKDAIFIIDSNASIIDFNKSTLQQFGYSATELKRISFNDLFSEIGEVIKIYNYLEEAVFFKDKEVHLVKKNGDKFIGLMTASIIDKTDKQGNVYGYMLKEITPIKEKAFNELEKSYHQLRLTINGIIEAIAIMVNIKDPYTAGHQNNVSEIAVKIAVEMKLSDDRIEAVRIASLLHDLGKISLPAEILSKPGMLRPEEFSLMKSHPVMGYDIIRPIQFPWPIADIVRQHHERIDGTGYPDGLKDGEILLEAKIIGVADVIEAMSSHRPYRPALGIKEALKEITAYSGTRYDIEVAEVAVRIFRNEDAL
ncbi:MAG: HD domain-containing protein [Spirochaetes bacterium]|nr:HD domain-containing protein [Spirochaetota bacterium]